MTDERHPGWPISHGSTVYRNEDGLPTELRFNDDGTLDEVCARGFIHIEQMDDTSWWISVNGVHINFNSKKPIAAMVIPNGGGDQTRVPEKQVDAWADESTRLSQERRAQRDRATNR